MHLHKLPLMAMKKPGPYLINYKHRVAIHLQQLDAMEMRSLWPSTPMIEYHSALMFFSSSEGDVVARHPTYRSDKLRWEERIC